MTRYSTQEKDDFKSFGPIQDSISFLHDAYRGRDVSGANCGGLRKYVREIPLCHTRLRRAHHDVDHSFMSHSRTSRPTLLIMVSMCSCKLRSQRTTSPNIRVRHGHPQYQATRVDPPLANTNALFLHDVFDDGVNSLRAPFLLALGYEMHHAYRCRDVSGANCGCLRKYVREMPLCHTQLRRANHDVDHSFDFTQLKKEVLLSHE